MDNKQFPFERNYLHFCTNITHYTFINIPTQKADMHLKHRVEL